MALEVDLQCFKCYKKFKKVLCKFPQIRDQIYIEEDNRVLITVKCCSPEKIRDKLCSKGGGSIKSVLIIPPPPPPPREKAKPKLPEIKPEKTDEAKKKPEKPRESGDKKAVRNPKRRRRRHRRLWKLRLYRRCLMLSGIHTWMITIMAMVVGGLAFTVDHPSNRFKIVRVWVGRYMIAGAAAAAATTGTDMVAAAPVNILVMKIHKGAQSCKEEEERPAELHKLVKIVMFS
ncbi:hypothetical protein V6N12_068842 [Hibiscus sabdariffa]|uniref:Uncharacterized protein n=1 Tax=Hibiscus sabdariffa TaxID=183260 RepID=A0ABR2B1G1_9ROSI